MILWRWGNRCVLLLKLACNDDGDSFRLLCKANWIEPWLLRWIY
jgi:hypothetical protein